MAEVIIYTGLMCSYCERSKALLREKNVAFEEINVAKEPERREEMIQKSNGGRTVPQIFINGLHVGGCDDLFALERAGKLDGLISGEMSDEPA